MFFRIWGILWVFQYFNYKHITTEEKQWYNLHIISKLSNAIYINEYFSGYLVSLVGLLRFVAGFFWYRLSFYFSTNMACNIQTLHFFYTMKRNAWRHPSSYNVYVSKMNTFFKEMLCKREFLYPWLKKFDYL